MIVADEGEKPIRLLEKVEKPIPRPPTPTIDAPTKVNNIIIVTVIIIINLKSQEEEEQELAIILLQRVIRGRAIQNKVMDESSIHHIIMNEEQSY